MSVWFLKNVNAEDVSKMLKKAYDWDVEKVDLTFVKSEDEEEQHVQFIAKCKNTLLGKSFTFMGRIFSNKIQCNAFNRPIGKQHFKELKQTVSQRLTQNIFAQHKKQTIIDDFVPKLSNNCELNKNSNLEVEMENKTSEEQIIDKLQEKFPEFSGFVIVNLEKVHAPRPELHFVARGEVVDYDDQRLDEEGNYVPQVYLFSGVKSGKYFDVVHEKQETDEEIRVL